LVLRLVTVFERAYDLGHTASYSGQLSLLPFVG